MAAVPERITSRIKTTYRVLCESQVGRKKRDSIKKYPYSKKGTQCQCAETQEGPERTNQHIKKNNYYTFKTKPIR